MMNLTRYWSGSLLLAALIGCNDSNPPAVGSTVTCEWFAGDNCYKRAVAEANACVDEAESGVLSADGLSCSFADGAEIAFATPPNVDQFSDYAWNFAITKAGATCATYKDLGAEGDGGFLLRTASGEVKEESVGMLLVMTCPNGEQFSIGAMDALSCIGSGLPGHGWSSSTSSVAFSFLGGPTSESLFSCRQAQP